MKVQKVFVVLAIMIGAADAFAGGVLWISAEFSPGPVIVRYNIGTGAIDMSLEPKHPITGGDLEPGTDVYNNLAIDASTLYIGVDDDNVFAKADPLTAVLRPPPPPNPVSYSPPVVAASLEDGAYHSATNTLWRATHDNNKLHQTDTDGNVMISKTVRDISHFIGLEWVGDKLYATSGIDAQFGEIMFALGPPFPPPSFTPIPIAGVPSGHIYGGLAYDQVADKLYMATTDLTNAYLWIIGPTAAPTTATLVVNLTTLTPIGYPAGFVVPDAMGWYPCAGPVCPPDVPTVTTWGLGVLMLALLTGFAIKFGGRRTPMQTDGINRWRIRWQTPMILAAFMGVFLPSRNVIGDPHPRQSVNVVIIGGTMLDTGVPCGSVAAAANVMGAIVGTGGCLPVMGGELSFFFFTAMAPSAVSAASLGSYDTAVLNVASTAMMCSTSTLMPAQQAALVAFVAGGKKLIIYDSECPPVDYSWLPYPFTTANPGAAGSPGGTLTIVEDNFLSTLIGDPTCSGGDSHCIDVMGLASTTDAVADMNVLTTFDPHWCVDMSGTNVLMVTGPVHTYAKFPPNTDKGLFIYNGLDQDYQFHAPPDPVLRKIWLQELQHPFNPSNLPCSVTVVTSITLTPLSATNVVGTTHTVTARLSDVLGMPPSIGIPMGFGIVLGPNTGAAGTCSTVGCLTDVNREVSFTYTGSGGLGVDTILACLGGPGGTAGAVCSKEVRKYWVRSLGVCCLPDSCTEDSPEVCLGSGGTYGGDDTVCAGDLDGDGTDDACPINGVVPAVSGWGLLSLILSVLIGMAIKFGRRRAVT